MLCFVLFSGRPQSYKFRVSRNVKTHRDTGLPFGDNYCLYHGILRYFYDLSAGVCCISGAELLLYLLKHSSGLFHMGKPVIFYYKFHQNKNNKPVYAYHNLHFCTHWLIIEILIYIFSPKS